jgi:hypothetical protein
MSLRATEILPPELWHNVAANLDILSLNNLCQTSKYFLHLVRPILYHSLQLRCDAYPLETLKLLYSDDRVARSVFNLSLSSPFPRPSLQTTNLSDTGAFQPTYMETILKLSSLRKLSLRGSIFRDEDEIQLFVQKVQDRSVPLKSLSYAGWTRGGSFPSHNIPLTGLARIRWTTSFVSDSGETVFSFYDSFFLMDQSSHALMEYLESLSRNSAINHPSMWKTFHRNVQETLGDSISTARIHIPR